MQQQETTQLMAERLRKVLQDRNISQKELSIASGIKEASISNYVNGKRKPDTQITGDIGRVLNVSPMYLMGFNCDEYGNPLQDTSDDNDINELFDKLDNQQKKIILNLIDYFIGINSDKSNTK